MGTRGSLRSALAFLTTLPIPADDLDSADFAGAGRWFALVGVVIGATLVALAWLTTRLWPRELAAALAVAAWVALTGGLHLDGALDSFDALAAAVPPARRLEILKDVHAGTFAVVGAVLLLLLKWVAVAALIESRPVGLLLPPVAGRAAMAWAQRHWPYARPQGLGTLLPAVPGALWLNGITLALVALALGPHGLLAAAVALSLAHLLASWIAGRLGGGLTGDSYGTVCELTELSTLLALTVSIGTLS